MEYVHVHNSKENLKNKSLKNVGGKTKQMVEETVEGRTEEVRINNSNEFFRSQ